MNKRAVVISAVVLLVLLAAVVGIAHLLSAQIASERQAAQERALLDLLPAGSYDNHPLAAPIALPDSEQIGLPAPAFAYLASRSGVASAVLLPARGTGYEGSIDLLLAISAAGQLLAVKVLSEHETPGLADISNAVKSPWLRGFFGHSSSDSDWRIKADGGQFDQMAGATVTSRAVSKAVQQGLSYFDAHSALLLRQVKP